MPTARPRIDTVLRRLRARIKKLEALLKCDECGHLRHEHENERNPCFGGRTPDMDPNVGEYCDCGGFRTSEAT